MAKRFHCGILFILCSLCFPDSIFGWGFYGHKKINETAVYTIPEPLFGFYKQHVAWLTDHSVDADKRRYMISEEACRHYLDVDHYESALPLDSLPHNWRKAMEKYHYDTLISHGIVPWHAAEMLLKLTYAFKDRNQDAILRISADLGHYVADLHVPLHASGNYNGQKTGQHGIHALWESRLPELFNPDYDLFTGTARYLDNPTDFIWERMGQSFGCVDSVLRIEKQLSVLFPGDEKYAFEQRGSTLVRVYSKKYCGAYHQSLGNMVERRMRESIYAVGSLWYTAWVNAGQPDMNDVASPTIPEPSEEDQKISKAYQEMLIKGREEWE